MTNFSSNTLLTKVAVAVAVTFGGAVAASGAAYADPISMDWTFNTHSADGETISGNVIVGLQYDAGLTAESLANGSQTPYVYDLTSATGSVTFSGNLNQTVSVSGPTPTTLTNQPDNEFFFQYALPHANDGFVFDTYGVGVNLATTLPGIDLALDITYVGKSNIPVYTYQLLALDSNGDAGHVAIPGSNDAHLTEVLSDSMTAVPEPTGIALLGIGLLGIAFLRRRMQAPTMQEHMV